MKYPIIVTAIGLGLIFTASLYNPINKVQAIENISIGNSIDNVQVAESISIGDSMDNVQITEVNDAQVVEDTEYINSPQYVEDNYNPDITIGSLNERIEIYNYLTSKEYNDSITIRTVNADGTISYVNKEGTISYSQMGELINNVEKSYINYKDKESNTVKLYSDGSVKLLVGDKYNQYYLDQVKEYAQLYDEYNQEHGTEWFMTFEVCTPREAQKIADEFKSMTIDEYKTYMLNTLIY